MVQDWQRSQINVYEKDHQIPPCLAETEVVSRSEFRLHSAYYCPYYPLKQEQNMSLMVNK